MLVWCKGGTVAAQEFWFGCSFHFLGLGFGEDYRFQCLARVWLGLGRDFLGLLAEVLDRVYGKT